MIRSRLYLVAAVAIFATAPLAAQQAQHPAKISPPAPAASQPSGPRISPGFKSFQPKLAHEEAAVTAAAAADRTVITISTLGLVIIAVLLILLLT
jgi:hypothetical protein